MKKIIYFIGVILLAILCSLLTVLIFNKNNSLNNIYDSVVYVESIDEETIKSGSGFVYKVEDNKNYIVTSYHVIEGYNDIYVYNNDKEKIKANILNYDEYTDIAILTIEDSLRLKELSIGNSDSINTNDKIYVVGTPIDIKNINTINEGIISFIDKEITIITTHGSSNLEAIEVSVEVDYGNSGGPLLNKTGKAIGMMFIKEGDKDIGYALPINFVMDIVEKLENNELNRPNLGAVMCNTTNSDLLNEYGINVDDVKGVVILTLKERYSLDNAGLKKGDIITRLDEKEIINVIEMEVTTK